ncbi:MAG: FAD:protein FMN transferase [Dermatophilaceae bacterium]
MTGPRVSSYEPVMGTSLEIRVWAGTQEQARVADAAALEEVQRLVAVFSRHDAGSELSRWSRGELADVSPDLAVGLELAQRWHAVAAGAFHPVCRVLYQRWERAVAEQVVPDPAELRSLAASLTALPFRVRRRGRAAYVNRLGDCRGVDLDALAKGHIVDRAVERARAAPGVRSVLVNAGGDLRHDGPGRITVRIEDPRRPYDNADPLTRVELAGGALATSGTAHRGFSVDGQWFGHVLDPRSGWPVRHTVSASVLAPDAASADAVATAVMVRAPASGLAFADLLDGVAALVVTGDGEVLRSRRWPDPPEGPATRT